MCSKKFEEATELFCYKVTLDDDDVYYVVAPNMQDAITHEEEIMGVKSCEYIGKISGKTLYCLKICAC